MVQKGMLYCRTPTSQGLKIQTKWKQKDNVFIIEGSMTKNVNAFHIDRLSLGCMRRRKLLQKVFIYDNNLYEATYQTNIPQSTSGTSNIAHS